MLDKLEMAPPDPILGLEEIFKKDSNPAKINLLAGVYKDPEGSTPIFQTVKRAEVNLLETETTKNYLPISGDAKYGAAVQAIIFGAGHEILAAKRAVTAHTPGGTGALRIAAEFLRKVKPDAKIWISKPTWPNHGNVFRAAGMAVAEYPYFDAKNNTIDFPAFLAALKSIPEGDVVLLHGSCHNPTGADPDAGQWKQIAAILKERNLMPLIDFAYQGLAVGMREDAEGVLTVAKECAELLIASSFSKNFGLYDERVGALTLVAASQKAAEASLSHIKTVIRANYSNPPFHGAGIVSTIWNDPALRAEWEKEVARMRARIQDVRKLFAQTLAAKGVKKDFSFIENQRGLFSFTGLTKEQVIALREKHSIYIVESGRINVAGINEKNIDTLCAAIAEVLK